MDPKEIAYTNHFEGVSVVFSMYISCNPAILLLTHMHENAHLGKTENRSLCIDSLVKQLINVKTGL